ncbi:hypothetical protein [Fodinicola feengrottensis]|nr:hypothetical protein [Fodinicola feengrottensis]
MLLYGGTLTACALAFNLIWRHAARRDLLVPGISAAFRRDVGRRYLLGLAVYLVSTLLSQIHPWITLALTAVIAVFFLLGPSPRQAVEIPAD